MKVFDILSIRQVTYLLNTYSSDTNKDKLIWISLRRDSQSIFFFLYSIFKHLKKNTILSYWCYLNKILLKDQHFSSTISRTPLSLSLKVFISIKLLIFVIYIYLHRWMLLWCLQIRCRIMENLDAITSRSELR